MPFVQIYLSQTLEDRSRKEISLSIHESLVAVFGIPENDYFQVIHETRPADLLYPRSYLGVPHGSSEGSPVVYIQIVAREGRTAEQKQALYRSIAEKIAGRTAIAIEDVIIVLVENTGENWSFGRGEAQMVNPDWRKATEKDPAKLEAGWQKAAPTAAAGQATAAGAAAGVTAGVGAAGATPGQSISRRQLLAVETGERTITGFQAHEIRFGPGQKGGLHFHPCPVAGYIIAGTALLQVEGEEPQVLRTGQAFYEPATTRILHFDNHSDTEPLTFCAFYLLNGEQSLIEMIGE